MTGRRSGRVNTWLTGPVPVRTVPRRPAGSPFDPPDIGWDRSLSLSFRRTPLSDTPQGTTPEITIYSTAICPYCVAAKNFLKSRGQAWTEVRIDLDPAEREKMIAKAKRTSVPQIFVGDVHVGGYDDMIALHRAGKLEPLLAGGAA
ncbi:glutaredoxin 3 [Pseudoxanthomonas sp. PXM01]|nr:glutaredoxin 3 [Pseudoxanthomonas sp. PXM01]